jgi:signal transduction histidine kinase
VDGDGVVAARPTLMAEVLERLTPDDQGVIDEEDFGPATRRRLPDATTMVWARRPIGADGSLLLAVFREVPVDEPDDYRADVLAAFATQAATVVANVELHEDVQRSLGHQLELNRQKGEFVAAVSHELRTPLTSILSAVQTVQRLDHRMTPEQRAHVLQLGWSQGKRLHGLIEDLLLVAAADHRQVPCDRQPVDLAALVDELEQELQAVVDNRLVVALAPDARQLLSDQDKVRRILINLVTNAGKYAPEGPIELTSHIDERGLVVAVTDHGPGIPEQDRERIFDRFVQLDQSSTRAQGGTGLGLHLSRQLAELLGARLALGAASDGGARFELSFPVAAVAAAPGRSDGPEEHATRHDGLHPVGPDAVAAGVVSRPSTPHSRDDARLATVAREG